MRTSNPITKALAVAAAALVGVLIAAVPASAASKDRNHDRIPDRWEAKHGLSLKVNQARKDQDTDGLRNRGEWKAMFDPRDDDTDGDGVEDGDEGAGTIASFDATTGELVIDVFSGDTVTGTVNADTEIECENDDATEPDDHGDDVGDDVGDDEGDDDGGPGHERSSHDGSDDHGDDDANCTVDALVAGAIVREAELDLTADGLVYEEIELK